jgi:hypothetical protein
MVDIEPRPSTKHILARRNNHRIFSKENCYWVTPRELHGDRHKYHLLTFEGQTKTLAQWARDVGISRQALNFRLKKGWSLKKVLSPKPQTNNSPKLVITFAGKTQTIKEWSKETGVGPQAIYSRVFKLKWPIEQALGLDPISLAIKESERGAKAELLQVLGGNDD